MTFWLTIYPESLILHKILVNAEKRQKFSGNGINTVDSLITRFKCTILEHNNGSHTFESCLSQISLITVKTKQVQLKNIMESIY